MTFGLVTSDKASPEDEAKGVSFWDVMKVDGILGMAFPVLAQYNLPTFLDLLVAQQGLDKAIFSFFLARHDAAAASDHDDDDGG